MQIKKNIKNLINEALENLEISGDFNFVVEHPENLDNGDYSTNVAMVCAKKLGMNPKELAEKIYNEIIKINPLPTLPLTKGEGEGGGIIQDIQVASPGFINFYLSKDFFVDSVKEILKEKENFGKNKILNGKKVMVEYTQPNPFKPFHIGHLMSNSIGESVSRIFEFSGASVIHVNYQGDIGLHVAKAIYVLIKDPLLFSKSKGQSSSQLAKYIGECYSKGSNLYDTDENIKKEIDIINKKIYEKSDSKINEIYTWGRKITLEAFEEIYKLLGTKFDKYYFESDMLKIGKNLVLKNTPKIFEESNGAIIFKAEKYDSKLHTRVFINSQGLPTYETKELGLTLSKFKKGFFEKKLDLSVVTTAVEQAQYMKVVQKAISLIYPDLENRMKHITHGMMRLASGKMSSRKGNVITGEELLHDSMDVVFEKVKDREFNDEEKKRISEIVGVAALKYSILKSSLNSDIIYDFEKSISFEGDSGPYLQYSAVRANSILIKAKEIQLPIINYELSINKEIINLEKLLYQFPEVVERSYSEFAPHYIATYLTELTSAFNNFYGNNKILPARNTDGIATAGGDTENKNMNYQLDLVKAFYQTMKNGLWLLGIEVPERM
ncbi:MAG: arginine--tRNA ligase [Candidatus Paceibacterota bacterium]